MSWEAKTSFKQLSAHSYSKLEEKKIRLGQGQGQRAKTLWKLNRTYYSHRRVCTGTKRKGFHRKASRGHLHSHKVGRRETMLRYTEQSWKCEPLLAAKNSKLPLLSFIVHNGFHKHHTWSSWKPARNCDYSIQFPRLLSITNDYKLCSLGEQQCIVSYIYRLDIWNQGVIRAMLPLKPLEDNLSMTLSASGSTWCSWVCGCSTAIPASTFALLCSQHVSIFIWCSPPLIRTPIILD